MNDLFSQGGDKPRAGKPDANKTEAAKADASKRRATPPVVTDTDYSAKDIEVLEGLEPVRRRPGMYIGGTDEAALHHLAAEVLDNAMDEAVAGHASFIEVHLEIGNYLTIRDNGRGIPVDPHPKFKNLSALEVILTTLHSGGKFGGKAYNTSGGLHGVGSSVVNALSDVMEVEVARDRVLWKQSYALGKPTTKLINAGPVHNRRGTTIRFHPDPSIFGPLRFVVASPAFHRWHHALDDDGIGRNFAAIFPFIDLAFGTFHLPESEPGRFGAPGADVPDDFAGQLAWPLRPSAIPGNGLLARGPG